MAGLEYCADDDKARAHHRQYDTSGASANRAGEHETPRASLPKAGPRSGANVSSRCARVAVADTRRRTGTKVADAEPISSEFGSWRVPHASATTADISDSIAPSIATRECARSSSLIGVVVDHDAVLAPRKRDGGNGGIPACRPLPSG